MRSYEYQWSRSLLDLYRRSLFQSNKIFSSKAAGPIKAKFQAKPLLVRETKFCSNDLGHMTKMATMPIYDKTPLKIIFWNQKLNDIEMWYRRLGPVPNKDCSNDAPCLIYKFAP